MCRVGGHDEGGHVLRGEVRRKRCRRRRLADTALASQQIELPVLCTDAKQPLPCAGGSDSTLFEGIKNCVMLLLGMEKQCTSIVANRRRLNAVARGGDTHCTASD